MARQATVRQSQSNVPIRIRIVETDLKLSEHQEAVLAMVDAYSRDAMGNAKPLDPDVRARLVPALRKHATTLIFLAFADERPVGRQCASSVFRPSLPNRLSTSTIALSCPNTVGRVLAAACWRLSKPRPENSAVVSLRWK